MVKVTPTYKVSTEVEERIRKIDKFIEDKEIGGFWYFPHHKGFFIIKNCDYESIEKYVKEKELVGKQVVVGTEVRVSSNLKGWQQ